MLVKVDDSGENEMLHFLKEKTLGLVPRQMEQANPRGFGNWVHDKKAKGEYTMRQTLLHQSTSQLNLHSGRRMLALSSREGLPSPGATGNEEPLRVLHSDS